MRLPPLQDDETFAHQPWVDDGEVVGVEMTLKKGRLEIVRIVLTDQVYYARCDVLRPVIEEMLVEIRAVAGDGG